MNNLQNILLLKNTSIKKALEVIEEKSLKIAIIVNDKEQVIGTINDGDIRRAILKGYTIDDSIEEVYFRKPTLCNINEPIEKIMRIAITKKLYQIPIINDEGKLVKIEDLATMMTSNYKDNHVILMAGGLGSRLQPLTLETPKPLLYIGGKPILETIIENLSKYGFKNITISVNYKSDKIINYFKDGSSIGVNISYLHENNRLGTAGALSLLESIPTKPFIVMNADILTDINFEHLLNYHYMENSHATMCVRNYDLQIPYGVIEMDNQSITNITEKPIHSFFVNAGIYVLSPTVLEYIPHNTFYDMPTLFETMIKKKEKVLSFPIHEYWMDIGKISDFQKAQLEYTDVFEKQ